MLSGKHIFSLLFADTAAGALVIIGAAALLSLLFLKVPFHRRISALLLFTAAFSLYDVFGYDFIVMTNSTASETMAQMPQLREHYTISLNAYRIVQVTFQIVLSAAVLFAAGWRAMLGGNLIWMGGGCDLIYYAATLRSLPAQWDWLWFTPLGMFVDALPLTAVLLQSAVLTALALFLVSPAACRFLPCDESGSGKE